MVLSDGPRSRTCSPAGANCRRASSRWDIENHGFNELVKGWHADHIYRHDPNAIECFLLIAFLACNLFHAFFTLNLKPEIRKSRSQIFWRRFMAAEIYAGINPAISP